MTWNLPINYNHLTRRLRGSVRHQYIEEQGGMCYWCKHALKDAPPKDIMDTKINALLFPAGFFNSPIHLQHCHKTGMTEGAVHARCNAIMWQYHGR